MPPNGTEGAPVRIPCRGGFSPANQHQGARQEKFCIEELRTAGGVKNLDEGKTLPRLAPFAGLLLLDHSWFDERWVKRLISNYASVPIDQGGGKRRHSGMFSCRR
jgi:hypothetical protein